MNELSQRDLFIAHALSGLTPAFVELAKRTDDFKEKIQLTAATAITLADEVITQLNKNEILPTKVHSPAHDSANPDSVS